MRIAIIGAGLAGLVCADHMQAAGHRVTLFEKSRGVGGRMSTRRTMLDGQLIGFDHGAQFMTVRDAAFRAAVECWAKAGVAAPWPDAGADAWVGVPGMNAPAKHMASGLDVRLEQHVEAIRHDAGSWRLLVAGRSTAEPFEAAIVALPAEQAATMLEPVAADWAALAADTPSDPCWTVMAAFAAPLTIATGIVTKQAPIGWAARDANKPGRVGVESWVIQADAAWSRNNLEQTPERVAEILLDAFAAATGITLPTVTHSAAHRWRYARSGAANRTALWDADRRLGVCGDWLIGPRVENAFASGAALAELVGR